MMRLCASTKTAFSFSVRGSNERYQLKAAPRAGGILFFGARGAAPTNSNLVHRYVILHRLIAIRLDVLL